MSLLRTRAIRVGSMIAFTADPTAMNGVSLMWGNPAHMNLTRGDVVQVLSIEVGDGTPWAKVQVIVVRGKAAGRTGHVCIDMGERLQRCWQALTVTGSMAPVRAKSDPGTGNSQKILPDVHVPQPPASRVRNTTVDETCSWSFDLMGDVSVKVTG